MMKKDICIYIYKDVHAYMRRNIWTRLISRIKRGRCKYKCSISVREFDVIVCSLCVRPKNILRHIFLLRFSAYW